MRKKLVNSKQKISTYIFIFSYFIFSTSVFAAPATDPLSGAKQSIYATFGPTSTIAYGMYVAEIVVSVAAYIRTKNLMVLLGIPVLWVFTYGMFTAIQSVGG